MMKTLAVALLVVGMLVVAFGFDRSTAQAEPGGAGAKPKELVLDLGDKVTLKLVQIPAGKFVMGSLETEELRDEGETPHEVTISQPFYMGVTHVTVDQFAAFVKESGYKTDAEKVGWSVGVEIKDGKLGWKEMHGCTWRNPSIDQKGNHPVVQVSWNDAVAFCEWLSKKSSKSVYLPTEAQWEYACRAGTKTAYPWGDNPDGGKGWANCGDASLKKQLPNVNPSWFFSWDDGFVFTSPVGSFKPNGFGLYDMIGNAWQWCGDRYGDYEQGPVTDPTGAGGDSGLRVQRGGSWSGFPRYCRSAHRRRDGSGIWLDDYGFRVAVLAAGVD